MAGNSTKVGPVSTRVGTTLYPGFSNTVPPGFGRIQRIEKGAQRFQRGGLRPTSGNFTRLPIGIISTPVVGVQTLLTSSPSLRKIGGVSPTANTAGFAYTSTDASITWYWDGTNGSKVPVITRADSSRLTLPTLGSGLTVSGLAASTTYYFLPIWNVNVSHNVGWIQGTVGDPLIAFVVADTTDAVNNPLKLLQQTAQQNEPLSAGYMTAATAAGGGSGSGGAGGGGGGFCVMEGTEITTLGGFPFSVEVNSETEWVHLKIEDGRELYCTYEHPLYHAVKGKVRADELSEGDLVITDCGQQRVTTANFSRRVCRKHKIIMTKGHLFWANGILSHNVKPRWVP